MSNSTRGIRDERGLLRPQVLAILALVAAAMFAFQIQDAKPVFAESTGLLSPADSSGGWSGEANAHADGAGFASSQGQNVTSTWEDFGISIPDGAIIDGIELRVDAWSEGTGCDLGVRLSWGDGSSGELVQENLAVSETTYTFGISSSTAAWGSHTWTPNDFDDGNFAVVLRSIDGGGGCDGSFSGGDPGVDETFADWVAIEVFYTTTAGDAPGTPTLLTPGNNTTISDLTPTFTWIEVTDPDDDDFHYEVQISTDCTNGPFSNNSVTDAFDASSDMADPSESFTLGGGDALDDDEDYCWRVRAIDENDNEGEWSVAFTFSTDTSAVLPLTNPDLGESCGIDVVLVIDNSASITDSQQNPELTNFKSALNTFVTALAPTMPPTRIGVVSFNTNAALEQALTDDDSDVTNAINGVDTSGGFTNWEDALTEAAGMDPDLIVMATDGDPTASDGNPDGPTDIGQIDANDGAPHLAPAIEAANDAKTGGAHVFAIGIGIGGESVTRLQQISGTDQFNGSNVTTADYLVSSNFSDLAGDLAGLAEALCGGTVTVTKLIDGQVTANSQGWTFSASPGAVVDPDSGQTDANGQVSFEVDNGSQPADVTIAETFQGGYSLEDVVCVDQDGAGAEVSQDLQAGSVTVSVGPNDIIACEFDNSTQPTLTLVKNLVNDDGGEATVASWTLEANANGGAPEISGVSGTAGASATVPAGTYVLSETGSVPGYTNGTTWDCVIDPGDDLEDVTQVTLSAGQSATCTITNDDIAPTLTLVKSVTSDNGGQLQAGDFELSFAHDPFLPADVVVVTQGQAYEVEANTDIRLYEETEPGYQNTGVSGDSCPNGLGSSFQLQPGQNVTCTVHNDDVPTSLTLIKRVVNDDGGSATAGAWTLSADTGGGAAEVSVSGDGQDGTNNDLVATYVANNLAPGEYTIAEDGAVSGYSAGGWSCSITDTPQSEDASRISVIQLTAGAQVTCEITNDDIAPSVTLLKDVTNRYGGTLGPSDFTLRLNGAPVPQNAAQEVTAGLGNTIEELPVKGYEFVSITGDPQCPDALGEGFTLGLGEHVTCTVHNTDIEPLLTVTKVVVNDDTGTAAVADFALDVSGTAVVSGAQNGFDAGSYTVGETGPTGYNATFSGDCDGTGNVTLEPGDVKSCTITNDDKPALTLVKHVDNGQTGATTTAAAFTLTADGAANDFSDPGLESPGRTYLLEGLSDTFTLSETGLDGYQAGNWACSGGEWSDAAPATVTVTEGDSATCTITNTAVPSTLWLIKEVVNDDGGTNDAGDWVLFAAGPANVDSDGETDETDDGPADLIASYDFSVPVGSYALSEQGPDGYAAGGWQCTVNQQPVAGDNDSPVLVGLDQTVICQITNADQPASLSLEKLVDEDSADPALWALCADLQGGGPDGCEVEGNGTAGPTPVSAGTYDLSEDGASPDTDNYAAGGWTCYLITEQGEQQVQLRGSSEVSVASGQAVVCRVFNDLLPAITVEKTALDPTADEDGEAIDFLVEVTNQRAEPVTIVSITDDVFGDILDLGNLLVLATTCSTVTIPADGSYSCVFTAVVSGDADNPQENPHVNTVTVVVTDDDGNEAQDDDDAEVGLVDELAVDVEKSSPGVGQLPEPEDVTFLVEVTNLSSEPVEIVSLVDDVYGDITFAHGLIDSTDCETGVTIAPNATYSCEFEALAVSTGQDIHVNTVTVVVREETGDGTASASDPDVITFPFTPDPDPDDFPSPGGQPAVNEVAGVQDEPEPAPVQVVLPAALPSTGSRAADEAIAWMLVLSAAAIGLSGLALVASRLVRGRP